MLNASDIRGMGEPACPGGCRTFAPPSPPPRGPGSLFLWPPKEKQASQIPAFLSAQGLAWQKQEASGSYLVKIGPGPLDGLAKALRQGLPADELWQGKSLFLADRDTLQPRDFGHLTHLGEWAGWVHSDWFLTLLHQDRLFPFYQPIFQAADPSSIFGHEALIRGQGHNGEIHGGGAIISAATDAGLLDYVDCLARNRAISDRGQSGLEPIFVNFSPRALSDTPDQCLASASQQTMAAGLDPSQVVFEVVEADRVDDEQALADWLQGYRNQGFRVALDDLGSGYGSLSRLETLRPDFVKLDRSLIQGVHRNGLQATVAGKMLEAAREHGIGTIAEGVEVPEELQWAQENGADYIQGFLLGRPRSPAGGQDAAASPFGDTQPEPALD